MQPLTLSSTDFVEKVAIFVENLDFLDILILRKFFSVGEKFPKDTKTYCFPILYEEMKRMNNLKIGREAFRKRLDNLVRLGLLEKIRNSNPTCYLPVKGVEDLVKVIITKFFLMHGLMKFSDNL
jgi:hypothetical protein